MGLVDKKKRELSFLRKKYFSHPPPNFKTPAVLWTTKYYQILCFVCLNIMVFLFRIQMRILMSLLL